MHVQFKSLSILNFKNHSNLQILFGDITSIAGRNGVGKSTIAETITWVLFGTDPFGTKLDPKPIGDSDAETVVELLINIDGKDILIGRKQKKTAKYFINEVPKKAKEFEAWVEALIDKQAFLSLFNPNYFSTQHWQTRREQLLTYVSEPLKAEVFAELSKLQVELLEEKLKSIHWTTYKSACRTKKHMKSHMNVLASVSLPYKSNWINKKKKSQKRIQKPLNKS